MGLLEIAEYIGAITTVVAALKWLLGRVGRLPDLRSLPGATHSFSHEIAALVPIAVLMNLAGALLATVDRTVFLDMVGTLVAAIVLGPWWGALIGLVSNMAMHALVVGVPIDTELEFLPFAMVQIAGAFYWGSVSRLGAVRTLLSSAEENVAAFARAILILGAGGGLVTGATSAWVIAVVMSGQEPLVALNAFWTEQVLRPSVILTEIAGKISCVVIAALVVRALFPVFLRASTHHLVRSGMLPVCGLLAGCAIYAFALLESRTTILAAPAWIDGALAAWPIATPLVFLLGELGPSTRASEVESVRRDRIRLYERLAEVSRPADQTFRLASLLSILGAFLAVALTSEDVSPRQVALRMIAVVGFLLIVTWSFEVAARHNRLDQLLLEEERRDSGAAAEGDALVGR